MTDAIKEEIVFNFHNKIDYCDKLYYLFQLGEYKATLLYAQEFLKKYPDDTFATTMVALAKTQLNNYSGVEQPLLQALKKPRHITASDCAIGLMEFYALNKNHQKSAYYAQMYLQQVEPQLALVYYTKAEYLFKMGQINQALDFYRKSVDTYPTEQAYLTLIAVLRNCNLHKEAITRAKKALFQIKGSAFLLSEYAATLKTVANWQGDDIIQNQLRQLTLNAIKDHTVPPLMPFSSVISIEDSAFNYEVAKVYAQLKQLSVPKLEKPYTHLPRQHEKLRIGYVSTAFNEQPIGHMFFGALKYHDRNRFQTYIYATSAPGNGTFENDIKRECDVYLNVCNYTIPQLADKIYEDEIDILIDLDGYIFSNRLALFSYRPAPVQITYLGYPGTTGASYIDYIIADKIIIPPEQQPFYSEKVLYMPECYQLNGENSRLPEHFISKSEQGLPEDKFIFACFNLPRKIDQNSFNCWMTILNACPDAVLWFITDCADAKANLCDYAKAQGIASERLYFSDFLPIDKHLARIRLADVMLDTFICNAHSTASDTLWANVPIVTLQGHHFCSRVCSSLLQYVGLADLVAKTPEEYIALATKLAKTPKYLQKIKKMLNKNIRDTLFNTQKTIRNLEQCYQQAWDESHARRN